MTRHQALQLLITRRIPEDLAAIEATLRAISSRMDAIEDEPEYEQVHQRLDELLVARDAALERAEQATHDVLV
jgi:tetrahydromethanopterin S-methyltransferase subunit G